jgi:hypothetical protein
MQIGSGELLKGTLSCRLVNMSRQRKTRETDLEAVAVGHADPGGDGSVSVVFRDGVATILPTAMRSLRGPALEVVEDLQDTVRRIAEDQDRLAALVTVGRSVGLSWGSLGWCIGTTGQACAQRFGPPPAPKVGPAPRRRK